MSETANTVETAEAPAEVVTKNIPRGILHRGRGNHRNVTEARIRPASGTHVDAEGNPVVIKTTAKSADVKLSAGATSAWAAMELTYNKGVADEVCQAAIEWASARGSKRVWDIDFAFATGHSVSPEGAAEFRKQYSLAVPSTPWPTKPEETPDATTKGTVINPETGRIAKAVVKKAAKVEEAPVVETPAEEAVPAETA